MILSAKKLKAPPYIIPNLFKNVLMIEIYLSTTILLYPYKNKVLSFVGIDPSFGNIFSFINEEPIRALMASANIPPAEDPMTLRIGILF